MPDFVGIFTVSLKQFRDLFDFSSSFDQTIGACLLFLIHYFKLLLEIIKPLISKVSYIEETIWVTTDNALFTIIFQVRS